MKRKNWIITCVAVIGAASLFIFAGFTPKTSIQKDRSTCCQKMKNCAAGTHNNASGDLMENISRQFLSISTLVY
jgi:hypothetical protein